MYRNRKLVRAIQNFYQRFQPKPPSTVKEQSLWLLRSFIVTKKRPDWVNAGFVLPTVAMVSLVVVLLTIAILFRSFERSKNASNVRVNQVVLNAAMPAIDRAKAKIDKLFTDPTLPRSTPSDSSLYTALTKGDKLAGYTFGDETPLAVRYDIDGNKAIDSASTELEKKEVSNTAWRFPVDTDNNGKYDSFTLYSINFRSPSRGSDGKFDRARASLDARTPPMDDGSLGGLCAGAKGTSSSLIGDSGWYKSGGNLKKSFFIYVTTVPITETDANTKYGNKYERYRGNQGFSAVEFQQDQERIPIVNNAVVYEDDLEITPGAGLNLNGRVFTNSNLLTGRFFTPEIRFYQVSSPNSCFYEAEFSKIIVGGNLGYGRISESKKPESVIFDLFQRGAAGKEESVKSPGKDDKYVVVDNTAAQIAYNARAYADRIKAQVEATIDAKLTYPQEVQGLIAAGNTEREALEAYFKKRTRKVPFADPDLTSLTLQGNGTDKLRGPDEWIYPFNLENNTTSYTGLSLNVGRLLATEPNKLKEVKKESEQYLGDRILIGNNLPALWFDKTANDFVGVKTSQQVLPRTNGDNKINESSTEWSDYNDEENKFRYRTTKIQELVSLEGATKRNGFFEEQAVELPKNPLDNVGGMRVVTGAGIYIDGSTNYPRTAPNAALPTPNWDATFVDISNSDSNRVWVNSLNFNNDPAKPPIIAWPDSMSMGDPTVPTSKGDLLMRATAVYHYKDNSGKEQTPMACVSSYYDPTNANTAQNNSAAWKNPNATPGINGKSNNGIVYPSYSGARTSAISAYQTQLENQARLVFPNGRFANEPLRNAMQQYSAGKPLSMADNSAIDTAVCAIQILNGTLAPSSSKLPHGTIYETSFLDARQIKSIENTPNTADPSINPEYKGNLEQRQPLEVRVTVLDVDKLRQTKIGSSSPSQEYLLPNSGIIYATRDDALLDLSDQPGAKQNIQNDQDENIYRRNLISPTDYKVDPTRRPNGIMLINGSRLDRESTYRDEEKGIILASNVPAYIKGDFNLHAKGSVKGNRVEEFEDMLFDSATEEIDWTNFYNRATLDKNFACRPGDPRLPQCDLGDSWRPASVLADAVTVLSDNFRFGFRNEGDYDLRNNAGNAVVPNYDFNNNSNKTDILSETTLKVDLNGDGDQDDTNVSEADQISVSAVRQKLGFFDNNFLTSADWFESSADPSVVIDSPKDFDTSVSNIQGSSYVNNFVTPIQRRVTFNEYLMEVCPRIPVHTCSAGDWSIDGAGTTATSQIGSTYNRTGTHTSGTTADLAIPNLQRYARRVAFARNTTTGNLTLDTKGQPVPLGIDTSGNIQAFPRNTVTGKTWTVGLPRAVPKALWFRTTERQAVSPKINTKNDTQYQRGLHLFYQTIDNKALTGTDPNEQPILVPVLQIRMPNDTWTITSGDPGTVDRNDLPTKYKDDSSNTGRAKDKERKWLQQASSTTTNLAIVGGDTPAHSTETNGGLENFVRYLENWSDPTDPETKNIKHSLSGSLIQYKRSAYATAPWQTLRGNVRSLFGSDYEQKYRTDTTDGDTPFYTPPSRQWGFDVGLLSQLPDLFAQTFTLPPTRKPNEFFREVNRDDEWVKTLLCAKTVNVSTSGIQITTNNAVPDNQRPTEFCKTETGDE
ncbi:hormogonium polysaccharide biosynthesis protein HpsA [Rivularia sp. UHCC 0363]|uniref:hormogonium polysaccharide biosynthesis protein HpsA n=1 Tax=Rivularia sp. UHCC 0363 TaxID=3110244 RepID=UPI002B20BD67|nr:hormogonium polysaccharide biosynthesis protein HpsA [Rivularia sp. UHCC 0363]MEA5598948.1 hormogonium polysaccharide biosynthesis protein HpsA [Rivularia sp. UHCC 0363]